METLEVESNDKKFEGMSLLDEYNNHLYINGIIKDNNHTPILKLCKK